MANESDAKRPALFGETSRSVKTLRAYYKKPKEEIDTEGIIREIQGESDRAALILLAALLDDAFRFRISTKLSFQPTDDEMEEI